MDLFTDEAIENFRKQIEAEYEEKLKLVVQGVKETIADEINHGATMEDWFANADFQLKLEQQAQETMFGKQEEANQEQAQDRPEALQSVETGKGTGEPSVSQEEPVFDEGGTTEAVATSSITPEMEAAALDSSSFFQQAAGIPTPEQPQVTESITPEMAAAAQESSAFMQSQNKPVKEPVAVESNIKEYSTLSKTDHRLSSQAMHTEMVERENAIHDEMKHGQDFKGFFDHRNPEQVNNYFEHSSSASLGTLATKNGKEYRESVKGKSHEVQANDAAYSDSLKFMHRNQAAELDFAQKFNPDSVDMVQKKHAFEQVDFKLMDKANSNEVATRRLGDPTVSMEEKKATQLQPITAEDKQEWFKAYKEFDKERSAYLGVESDKSYREQALSERYDDQFVKNYTGMMDKSNDRDFTFERKEVKPYSEYNKDLNNISDIEKNKTLNSFRDYKADELGGTWKHEYKTNSKEAVIEKPKAEISQQQINAAEMSEEGSRDKSFNLSNIFGKEQMKLSDYSPALQNIIMKADKKMAQEYGTKEITKGHQVEKTQGNEGKTSSMSAIQEANKGRVQTQGKEESAAMAAIKSHTQSNELKTPQQEIEQPNKKRQIEAGVGY
ncbi:hypothetical protein DFLDMN_001657 [Cupriavidus sp. H19C3]|uniref:hypothetical protein n=1 Tax=Cupriavidus sp. H19C3 TaxID=3241603 RepID=UPI003BF78953